MNIVFRVNASNIEGSGHFNRTFLLAKFFKKKNFNVYFLSNSLHKKYIKLLNKNNFKYFISKKVQAIISQAIQTLLLNP